MPFRHFVLGKNTYQLPGEVCVNPGREMARTCVERALPVRATAGLALQSCLRHQHPLARLCALAICAVSSGAVQRARSARRKRRLPRAACSEFTATQPRTIVRRNAFLERTGASTPAPPSYVSALRGLSGSMSGASAGDHPRADEHSQAAAACHCCTLTDAIKAVGFAPDSDSRHLHRTTFIGRHGCSGSAAAGAGSVAACVSAAVHVSSRPCERGITR